MAFITVFLVISTLATVAPAAVKRDDYASPVSSSSASAGSSSPVYSPSSASASAYSAPANSNGFAVSGSQSPYSAAQTNYAPSQAAASQAASPSTPDHVASASQSNFQASPGQSNPGNLYYYYYPVQDKNKENTGYQAAASNQYTSSVNPASSSDASGPSHLDSSSSSASSGSSPDLSYSAQDLTYSAQALNPGLSDYSGSAQASTNYDQTLSSLASQLTQQYGGYAANNQQSYGTQGNNAPSSYTGHSGNGQSANSYTPGNYGYDASAAVANGQDQGGQYSVQASNPVPNYGVNPNQATFIPAPGAAAGPNVAPNVQAFNPALYQQYQQQMGHFGNLASPSMPASSFEPTPSGYRRYGIGSFLMPMLALAGLSLLIPTVTSLTASGRKKRSVDGIDSAKESAFGKYFDRLERYYSIYKTAVEREECMNRIICELGDAMSGVRGKSPLFSDVSFRVLEKLVPSWMGNSVGVFKTAALSGEYGKCKKYTCQTKDK